MSTLIGRRVQVAFVDVLGPTPSEVLSCADAPAIVVPAFLSRGYHVRTDLPAHVAASGHPDVTVAPALGPSREVVRIVAEQLVESGWRRGDSVILAAAGTSDQRAQADLRTTATLLATLLACHVDLGFVATGAPRLQEAVLRARARRGDRRVAVASYLLADGLFRQRLHACGADVVSPALGAHPGLARLVASRFHEAASLLPAGRAGC